MIVTLFAEDYMNRINLPKICSGQFWLLKKPSIKGDSYIYVEGIEGHWYIRKSDDWNCNEQEKINTELDKICEIELNTNNGKEKALIVMEEETLSEKTYNRYCIKDNTVVSFGNSSNCDVVLNNDRMTNYQLKIKWNEAGGWQMECNNSSSYGIYVNSRRYKEQKLEIGDCITLFDFKVILGHGFIAINNPEKKIEVHTSKLAAFEVDKMVLATTESVNEEDEYFYRSPRFKRDIKTATFKIDPPPQNQIGEEMPLMMVIGPSMTMGMASLTTAVFSINNAMTTGNISGAIPSLVMSGSMLLGTVMWPIITKRYERMRRRKREQKRQEKYQKYIEDFEKKIEVEKQLQKTITEENVTDMLHCVDRIKNVRRNLWERSVGQNDFLSFRVGRGDKELDAEFKYSERRFTLDEDNLQDIMLDLCESPKIIKRIPLAISLAENPITGIIGNKKKRDEFLEGLIFQIASLYSYDEVKLVFIKDEDSLEYVKWFPHVWNDEHTIRFIAHNQKDVKDISSYLEREYESRENLNDEERTEIIPHYIIVLENRELANRAEIIKKICNTHKEYGFSLLFNYPELKDLPKECSKIVELTLDEARIYDKNDMSGKSVSFEPDIAIEEQPMQLSKKLSRIYLDKRDDSKKLPQMISFLEMCNVGKVEHLNVLLRWKDNNPVNSLETTVGVDVLGEEFKLDLHEKVHGPHGLVAGMTGSGKSEFIMTYILSMAINYHPYEVAFILIDYKGGGMAKAFENLPHTAGIITNLDGSAINRSLLSIESELKRRQAVFAKVSKQLGISNVDIYKYQKLYREKKVAEPLQHLFIISDEFAELKTQQPEFMEKLISAARIGRSLGVHLILATQKPAGVVDDQIWSNSRFRVCLKVQEKADSMDMLKRPDAAELVDTGRFYLQVGYNEIFQLGQSAWSGAPYYPSDQVQKEMDDSIEVIDTIGRVVQSVKYDKRKEKFQNPGKQLDVITGYLREIAVQENIKVRQLWLPPLAADLTLEELREKYNEPKRSGYLLEPIIGEYDAPEAQKQDIFRLPISKEGNFVLYGNAVSGKTEFLTTLIYSLIDEHTPDEVQFYILDFENENLKVFAEAPHIGEIVFSNEEEKVFKVFKVLKEMLEERKRVFRDYEGDFISYNQTQKSKFPTIMVMIHNYMAFRELYEDVEDLITYLAREGQKYGICFVLTANAINEIRFRLLQNVKQQIALQLNDEGDYGVVFGKTEGLYPAKILGRGLARIEKLHEFQTANIVKDEAVFQYIRQYCSEYRKLWQGTYAKSIAILPESVTADLLHDKVPTVENLLLPIGIETESLDIVSYDFEKNYITLITGEGNGVTGHLKGIEALLKYYNLEDVFVVDLKTQLNATIPETWKYAAGKEACDNLIGEIFDIFLSRNNAYKESEEKEKLMSEWDRKIILLPAIKELQEALSKEGKDKLKLILLMGCKEYNMYILLAEDAGNLIENAGNHTEDAENHKAVRYQDWYKQQITGKDAIWVGSGITDQYLLKLTTNTGMIRNKITTPFGYVVNDEIPVKAKLLMEGQ